MQFLRNAWYAVAWAEAIGPEALVERRVLGEPVVLFRDDEGVPRALGDVCPHRFSPLHLGRRLPGGRVQCPYHGLEFDASGACVRNPHGSGRIPQSARAKTYPLAERHTIVWIWMGAGVGDPSTIPDYSVLDTADPKLTTKRDSLRMDGNYLLITENLLDLSRVSFLHEGVLGNEQMLDAEIAVEHRDETLWMRRAMSGIRPPRLHDILHRRDGAPIDLRSSMRWNSPGCLLNEVCITDPGAPRETGTGTLGVHLLTPETETTTLYQFVAVRWNPRAWSEEIDRDIRAQLSDLRRNAFENEDKVIIDAQQRAILDPNVDTSHPILLQVDAGAARFRRTIERMIAREHETKAAGQAA